MMFDYNTYADMVGSSVKSMWGALLPEKDHRDAFNSMVDAKVALNKSIYNASKSFVESVTEASKSFTTSK